MSLPRWRVRLATRTSTCPWFRALMASLQFPSRRPGLSLSFAFLRPPAWLSDHISRAGTPLPTSPRRLHLPLSLFPKPANSRAHQSAFHSAPDPKRSLPGLVTPGALAPGPCLEQRLPRMQRYLPCLVMIISVWWR